MADRMFWMKPMAWQIALLIVLCGVVEGSLTGQYVQTGYVIGCSHKPDHPCYVAVLDNLSDEVTSHRLIVQLDPQVLSYTNSTYIEVIYMPTDDERDKIIVEVFQNGTKKEGLHYSISLKDLKKGSLVTTMETTSLCTSTSTSTPDTTTGPTSTLETTTGPTSTPDTTTGQIPPNPSRGPTPHSEVDNTVPILVSIVATLVLLTIIAVVIIGTVLAIKIKEIKTCKEKAGDVASDTI